MLAAMGGVSIPNGLPRPFSPRLAFPSEQGHYKFQSRTGSPGHLALESALHILDAINGFNPERAPQAI